MNILIVQPLAMQTRLPIRRLTALGHHVAVRVAQATSRLVPRAGLPEVLIIETRGHNTQESVWIRGLRRVGARITIVVAGKGLSSDRRIAFLDSGADDVVALPIAVEELVARIHAIQRRTEASRPTILNFADVQLNRLTRRATRSGHDLSLTTLEFRILECLILQPRQVVSRADLERELWTSDSEPGQRVTSTRNLIDVHVARLRRKVDRPFSVELIRTVRGRGFVLSEDTALPLRCNLPQQVRGKITDGSSPVNSQRCDREVDSGRRAGSLRGS